VIQVNSTSLSLRVIRPAFSKSLDVDELYRFGTVFLKMALASPFINDHDTLADLSTKISEQVLVYNDDTPS